MKKKLLLFLFLGCLVQLFSQNFKPNRLDSLEAAKKRYDSIIAKHNSYDVLESIQKDLEYNYGPKGNLNDKNEIRLRALNILTDNLFRRKLLDSALNVSGQALRVSMADYQELVVEAYNNQANIYYAKSFYNEGFNSSLKALELSMAVNDSVGKILALNDVGTTYWMFNDLEIAENYLKESLALSEIIPVDYQSSILNNLALVYVSKRNFDEAIPLYERAIGLNHKYDPYKELGLMYNNLGKAYLQKGDLIKANKYLNEALYHTKKLKDSSSLVLALGNLANINKKQENFFSARNYLDKALLILSKTKSPKGYSDIYSRYYKLNEVMGKEQEALENIKEFYRWRDSLSKYQSLSRINELQYKNEVVEKENEVLKLSEINLMQQNHITEKDRTINVVVLSGIIVILLIMVISFIVLKRFELRKQKQIFDAITNTEIEEQHRIARDLHDSIGTMLASVKNQLALINSTDRPNNKIIDKAKEMLSGSIDETRRISHNMMPEELVKFGLISAVGSILDNVMFNTDMNVKFEHDEELPNIEKSKQLHIYRIVQELVQNTLKHSKSDFLEVVLKFEDKQILLNVSDKGQGFNYDNNTLSGYGLKNIKSRVDFLNGKMKVQSKSQQGASFDFNIPIE